MADVAIVTHESRDDDERAKRLTEAHAAWLASKSGLSGSRETLRKYTATFASYAAFLHTHAVTVDGEAGTVATYAQAWSVRPSKRGAEVSRATVNHRLRVVSSFYSFAVKRGYLSANPIDLLDRPKVQDYASARALSFAEVTAALARIDRSTLLGARDYALLMLALFTGRRASELAALRWGDIEGQFEGTAIVTWQRTKGGKVERNVLPPHVYNAIVKWAKAVVGNDLPIFLKDSPVWRALSPRGTLTARGITYRAVALICKRRLGTTKVHRLRHTFAHAMEQSGAKVSEIQAALGHSSIATTGKYLRALSSEANPYAEALAALYGLGE